MIRIDADRHVNPAFVAFMEWERRHCANGPGDSVLVLYMHDGTVHRIVHQSQYLGGADGYKIERAILAAMEGGE